MTQSVPHTEDEQLVQALMSDDYEAWNIFLAKYQDFIKLTLRKTGIRQYDLEEALDKLLVKVILTIGNYNPNKASLKTWLHTITHNFAVDWLRSKDYRERKDLESIDAKEEERSGYAETRGKKFFSPRPCDDSDRKSVMQVLKENFSEQRIELIMLKHHDGRSWDEIGKELVPKYYPTIAAAKMDAKRITEKLKTLLEEY